MLINKVSVKELLSIVYKYPSNDLKKKKGKGGKQKFGKDLETLH